MSKADNKNHETVNQEEFMRKIGDLIAAGKQKKGVLEESEIRVEFKNLKLTDEQYELIVRVLEKNDIDVLQVVERNRNSKGSLISFLVFFIVLFDSFQHFPVRVDRKSNHV